MSDKSKRRLLKALTVGGGISVAPTNWISPVVQTVILPVHAQTSPAEDNEDGGGGGNGGGDVDPLCCVAAFAFLDNDNSLVLFNGLVQGLISVCYPTCDGANVQLVQGSTTLDIFDVFCRPGANSCGVTCVGGGSGTQASPGSATTLFPDSETAGLTLGPAILRVLTVEGVCGEFDITLIENVSPF